MKASRFAAIAASVAAIGLAGSALAQNLATGPEYSGHITDTRTGRVWTPNLDSLDAYQPTDPNHPVNREFNPRDQQAGIPGMVELHPKAELMGTVPITAGPTVPIVNIGDATLSAIPGKRWQVVLYLQNNSANTVVPMLNCRFTNSGRLVEETHVLVPAVGAGLRVGMIIYGPKVDLFVDRANCGVKSP